MSDHFALLKDPGLCRMTDPGQERHPLNVDNLRDIGALQQKLWRFAVAIVEAQGAQGGAEVSDEIFAEVFEVLRSNPTGADDVRGRRALGLR